MNDDIRDLPDPALTEALRQATPQPPLDAVDWMALQERIASRAAPLLRTPPRQPASAWTVLAGLGSRAGVITAAAAAVLAVWVALPERSPGAQAAVAFFTVEEELALDFGDGAAPLLLAGASDDELLDAVLFYDAGGAR
jgi:hypothetical protein